MSGLVVVGPVHIILIFSLSMIAVGLVPALALNSDESSFLSSDNTYANFGAGGKDPYSCAAYGGNAVKDGVCDNWKVSSGSNAGLDISFTSSYLSTYPVTYVYNLPCTPGNTIANDPTGLSVCPSTAKKDIYIELDCMHGLCPSSQVVTDVVKAFYNQGIQLHVQWGENPSTNSGDTGLFYCYVNVLNTANYGTPQSSCTTGNTDFQSYTWIKQHTFGTVAERQGNTVYCPSNAVPSSPGGTITNANAYNCLTAKRQVFHYVTFVNYQYKNPQYSGWGEIFGNDMVISLGNFENGVGTTDEQEAELMHEIGHNFGLGHGGRTGTAADMNNCKPNYLSVMSYTYLFRKTADVCRPLDFSNTALANLNENNLADSDVGSYQYPSNNPPPPAGTEANQPSSCPTSGQRPIWWSYSGGTATGYTGTTDDWNQNGVGSGSYSQVLNNLPSISCSTTTLTTLTGYNDWNYIQNGDAGTPQPLSFRNSTNFYQSAPQANEGEDIGGGLSHSDAAPTGSLQTLPTISIAATLNGLSVSVNGQAQATTQGASITKIDTNWGDGQTSSGQFPQTHTYSQGGTFTINATAYDSNGLSSSNSTSVTVQSVPPPGPNPDQTVAVAVGIAVAAVIIGIAIWSKRRRP
ncbi:MAG: hypothetical protein KGI25_00100 [Thaumarchaeota archaeon]|nr:hypothetical protein [Nitrososphaerota archaeon]